MKYEWEPEGIECFTKRYIEHAVLNPNVVILSKYQVTQLEIKAVVKMFLTLRNARYLFVTKANSRHTELMLLQISLPITILHEQSA